MENRTGCTFVRSSFCIYSEASQSIKMQSEIPRHPQMTLYKFLQQNESRDDEVGKFVRCCLLMYDNQHMTREELLKSTQLGYLLDCFPSDSDEEDEEQ